MLEQDISFQANDSVEKGRLTKDLEFTFRTERIYVTYKLLQEPVG